jgi:hypothetical protein
MDVKKHHLAVVLKQKMNSLKKDNMIMLKAEKLQYSDKWEEANMEMLDNVGLGTNCVQKGLVWIGFSVEFSSPSQLQGLRCHCFRRYTRQMLHI